jgi:hypothetical protein
LGIRAAIEYLGDVPQPQLVCVRQAVINGVFANRSTKVNLDGEASNWAFPRAIGNMELFHGGIRFLSIPRNFFAPDRHFPGAIRTFEGQSWERSAAVAHRSVAESEIPIKHGFLLLQCSNNNNEIRGRHKTYVKRAAAILARSHPTPGFEARPIPTGGSRWEILAQFCHATVRTGSTEISVLHEYHKRD